MNVLFASDPNVWDEWQAPLRDCMAENGLDPASLGTSWPAESVEVIVQAPTARTEGGIQDYTQFPNLKFVQNIWAGVERVVGNPTLKAPLARMVDPGLTQGMVEYCVTHTLRHHLDLDYWAKSQDGVWRVCALPLAWERRVTVLGMGELGSKVAKTLRDIGFPVTGWSRSPKELEGITCLHGETGLTEALRSADVLVVLLPLTDATRHLLNQERLALLPDGAFVINAGRGPLIDDDAMLAALDAGKVAHATLDVFAQEPLKPTHRYWSHPHVTVTPHIAAVTRPATAAPVVVQNLLRLRDGRELLHLVDREAGY